MKSTQQTSLIAPAYRAFAHRCLASCHKLLAQIEKAKESILAEFRETVQANEQLLHLAVTEAEALAWETAYPHLVFPMLAMEKAQAVEAWDTRQRSIRRGDSVS